MKVLVAGGSGMLGRALVGRYEAGGHGVESFSLSGKGCTGPADLSDAESVARCFAGRRFDLVIHAAAYSDVDGCENDPALAWRSNALSSKHLAAECARAGTPYVYVSTDYVFSGAKGAEYDEDDRAFPVSVYAMSKLAGEDYARTAGRWAIVRTSWLFGGENDKNFVNVFAKKITKESVEVLDDQRDKPTYVRDLAEGVEKIARDLAAGGKSGVFHFANHGVATRYDMTLEMKRLLGSPHAVSKTDASRIPNRLAKRPPYPVLSTAKYEKTHGPIRHWKEAMAEFLKGSS